MHHHPPPPSLYPHHHPHHPREFIDVLDILIRERRINNAEEMILYAQQHNEAGAVEFIRSEAVRIPDVDLLFRALSLDFEIKTREESARRTKDWANRRVCMIFPLPPHVHDPLLELPGVLILLPGRHRLPPHLSSARNVIRDRACREEITKSDVIIFEGFRDGVLFVDESVADMLDLRLVPEKAELYLHLRPFRHPDDVEFVLGSRSLIPI